LFEFGEDLLSYFELLAKIYVRKDSDDEKLEDKIEFDSLEKMAVEYFMH
jgi:hypothetical protein